MNSEERELRNKIDSLLKERSDAYRAIRIHSDMLAYWQGKLQPYHYGQVKSFFESKIERSKSIIDEIYERISKITTTISQLLGRVRRLKTERKLSELINYDVSDYWIKVDKTFSGVIKSYKYRYGPEYKLDDFAKHSEKEKREYVQEYVHDFLHSTMKNMGMLISKELLKLKGLKMDINMKVKLKSITYSDNKILIQEEDRYYNSEILTFINDDINEKIKQQHEEIAANIDKTQGSNWFVSSIEALYVNIYKYDPLKGSSWVELPSSVTNTKSVINIKNEDNECFKWSILASIHKQKSHRERVTKYLKYKDELNFEGITFPVKVDDIKKFEKLNKINVNVFSMESDLKAIKRVTDDKKLKVLEKTKDIYPIRLSCNPQNAINLLIYQSHYCLINDFNKLMATFTYDKTKKNFCMRCLCNFKSIESLNNHLKDCNLLNVSAVRLPQSKSEHIKFKNFKKKYSSPFVIYADFECLTCEFNDETHDCEGKIKKTTIYQKHKPCGYGLYGVCTDEKLNIEPVIYRGEDTVDKFIKNLYSIREKIEGIRDTRTINIENNDMLIYNRENCCGLCGEYGFTEGKPKNKVSKEDFIKYIGNNKTILSCSITNKYLGAVHSSCKYKFDKDFKIPVIFHNLKNYDGHFIIREANKYAKEIDCIPLNKEKYITFSLDNMIFLDSYQFMTSSLESLVSNLRKDNNDYSNFYHTSKFFDKDKLNLITKKGVYPYDYMNNENKFLDEELPKIEDFYSKLYNSKLSDSDYEHAKTVWDNFNLKNMGDYHDLYLKTDVLLLADVFENFRKICKNNYGLEPTKYLTAPGLSWDAMMLMTNIKLEPIIDIDMYNFIEKGIRGGISVISHRYAKANNKYLDDYDSKKEDSYITYLDANNLYGWAMSQSLPTDNIEWVPNDELPTNEQIINSQENDKCGYILEVDLEYPKELHDYHNDFPIAPENIKIKRSMLSNFNKSIMDKFNLSVGSIGKLTPNLNNKERYIVHIRNLKLYISLGLKLTKVHRAIKFNQSKWLEPYINLNTNKRAKAKDNFEKDFYKLMNNSVFGKTMENIRNRNEGELVKDVVRMQRLINSPRFQGNPIFYDKDYCFIEMKKKCVKLDKPIYVGFSILDLSKHLMYDFHYNFIKEKYNDKALLLFQDTDSLTYHIKTEDLYDDFSKYSDKFDFSEYPSEHKCFSNDNKKVVGKFKDETCSKPIKEFVGLRSKMYSFTVGNTEKKTAKGVSRSVKENLIKHEDYKSVLFNSTEKTHNMNAIRSCEHKLMTVSTNKKSLSCFNDKRYTLDDGISSYAYGHYNIN